MYDVGCVFLNTTLLYQFLGVLCYLIFIDTQTINVDCVCGSNKPPLIWEINKILFYFKLGTYESQTYVPKFFNLLLLLTTTL